MRGRVWRGLVNVNGYMLLKFAGIREWESVAAHGYSILVYFPTKGPILWSRATETCGVAFRFEPLSQIPAVGSTEPDFDPSVIVRPQPTAFGP